MLLVFHFLPCLVWQGVESHNPSRMPFFGGGGLRKSKGQCGMHQKLAVFESVHISAANVSGMPPQAPFPAHGLIVLHCQKPIAIFLSF